MTYGKRTPGWATKAGFSEKHLWRGDGSLACEPESALQYFGPAQPDPPVTKCCIDCLDTWVALVKVVGAEIAVGIVTGKFDKDDEE